MFLKNVGNRKIIFFSAISARVQKNFERKKLRVYQGLGLLLQATIDLVCAKNFPKTSISYLLIRTCACMYQGVRNVSSSKNFESALNEWYPNSRFTKHMELLVWEFLFFLVSTMKCIYCPQTQKVLLLDHFKYKLNDSSRIRKSFGRAWLFIGRC